MKESEFDIDHLRGWVGREVSTMERLDAALVGRFNATFDIEQENFDTGQIAPRLIHFCLCQSPAPTNSLDIDGHPRRGDFLPPVPLPRRMWAGGSVEFHDDLRVGDLVQRISRIADLSVKKGRTGTLCFVTVEHSINVDGRPIVQERQDIVYRGTTLSGPSAQAAESSLNPAPIGANRKHISPSPPLLFRYSAMTFNSHRIHYDRRYAIEAEGYPALVVQAPLQASLLLQFAAELHGSPPCRLSFRAASPLFDDVDFYLNAEPLEKKLRLWSAREGGPAGMTAEAQWP